MASAQQNPAEIPPEQREAIYRATYDDLPTFIDLIFSQSFEQFTRGDWVLERAQFMSSHHKSCFVGPRNHFKSTGIYAYLMWRLWQCRFNAAEEYEWAEGDAGLEVHYFSYKEKSAGYHIGEAKDSLTALIERNPWFGSLTDLKPTAETKAKWTWDGKHEFSVTPHGMLSHTRGIHCELVIVDDPFQDPEDELNPTKVLKINHVFKTVIRSIPTTDDDEIHVATTPQTSEDFPFDANLMADYAHSIQPAITDHKTESVIWPEWKSYDDLMSIKSEIGPKLFAQEFMCQPKSSEISFFRDEEVREMEVPGLTDWGEVRELMDPRASWEEGQRWLTHCTGVVAGFDVGKKRHPSHLAVFAVLPSLDGDDRAAHLVQLHEKWMDNWNYTRQVDYLDMAISYFQVDTLWYDDTRGEFESLREMGRLPDEMKGVTLSGKTQREMAGYLDALGSGDSIKLLNSGRQRRQITTVTQDLDAVETGEGHGEAFYSVGLAAFASQEHSWGSNFGTLDL